MQRKKSVSETDGWSAPQKVDKRRWENYFILRIILKGKFISMMDRCGRVRIPRTLHRIIETKYGNEVFITTVDVKDVRIYPLSEWELIERKMREQYEENRIIRKVMERTAFFGLVGKIDKQGRILIHKLLREKIKLEGEILIEGKGKYLKLSALQ